MIWLPSWRKYWRLKQWELAQLLGCPPSQVSRWERGHRLPWHQTVARVLQVLTAWERAHPNTPTPDWAHAVRLEEAYKTMKEWKNYVGTIDHVELKKALGRVWMSKIPKEHNEKDYEHWKLLVGFTTPAGELYWFYAPSANAYHGTSAETDWITAGTALKAPEPKLVVGQKLAILAQVKTTKPGRFGVCLHHVRLGYALDAPELESPDTIRAEIDGLKKRLAELDGKLSGTSKVPNV